MAKKKTALLLRRYVWLVNILHKQKLTFGEISDKWDCALLNEDKETLAKRTLQHHIVAVRDLFGFEIVCDRKNESRYSVVDSGDLENDRMRKWLYSTFSISALISESDSLRDRIILEDIPSGETYLTQIVEAIRDKAVLDVEYKEFGNKPVEKLKLCPCCVKIYHRRWYMIADNEGRTQKYSLDRIHSLSLTGDTFTESKPFDSEKYFENVIGITKTDEHVRVVLKVDNGEGKVDYFKSLPLHPTQHELPQEDDEYAIFQYDLCHTYDLYQEIMTHSYDVEVLAPLELREEMKMVAESMVEVYSKPSIIDKINNLTDKAFENFAL